VRCHDEHCLLSLESAQKGIEYFAYLAVGLGITSRIGGKSMSSRNDVLSVLWSGKSKIVAGDETIVFSALLLELFPGKTILVGVEDGAIPERVLLDDTEVMPSLSLGDVVAEELNITVPYGTVIVFAPSSVFLPTASAAQLGNAIGHAYGQIIIEALHRGGFPMEREMALLMGLARSSVSAVERLVAVGQSISRAAFEQALVATLYSALSGGGPTGDQAATLGELERRFGTSDADGVACQSADPKPMCFEEWLATLAPSKDEANDAGTEAEEVWRLRTSKI
jgi:hypothetical protein